MERTLSGSVVNDDCSSNDGTQNVQRDIREYFPIRYGEDTMLSFAGLVDDNSEFDRDKREPGEYTEPRKPINRCKASMAQFLEYDEEGYKILAKTIDEMAEPFMEYCSGGKVDGATGRYLSDVFLFNGRRMLTKALDILCRYGESRRNGMFGISVEEDHIHIIHDCAYSCGSCRCTFKEKIRPFGEFRPNRRFNKPIWQFKRSDWYDVLIYFFFEKRGTRKIWIRGKSWEIPSDGK